MSIIPLCIPIIMIDVIMSQIVIIADILIDAYAGVCGAITKRDKDIQVSITIQVFSFDSSEASQIIVTGKSMQHFSFC